MRERKRPLYVTYVAFVKGPVVRRPSILPSRDTRQRARIRLSIFSHLQSIMYRIELGNREIISEEILFLIIFLLEYFRLQSSVKRYSKDGRKVFRFSFSFVAFKHNYIDLILFLLHYRLFFASCECKERRYDSTRTDFARVTSNIFTWNYKCVIMIFPYCNFHALIIFVEKTCGRPVSAMSLGNVFRSFLSRFSQQAA